MLSSLTTRVVFFFKAYEPVTTNTVGSCVDFVDSSCCEAFTDPTASCARGSGPETCYCDALCFIRQDCCGDIAFALSHMQACIRCE